MPALWCCSSNPQAQRLNTQTAQEYAKPYYEAHCSILVVFRRRRGGDGCGVLFARQRRPNANIVGWEAVLKLC